MPFSLHGFLKNYSVYLPNHLSPRIRMIGEYIYFDVIVRVTGITVFPGR